MELTAEARNKLKGSQFVFPKERRYPISDLNHARDALARSSGKAEEGAVKKAVFAKYPTLKAHASHTEPKDDCPHCQDALDSKAYDEREGKYREAEHAASLASEHDEKHGRHEDCPNCAARKDGAACDAHADDTMSPNGPTGAGSIGGEQEFPMGASLSSPMTPPAADEDDAMEERESDLQLDKDGSDPWLPSGELPEHPLTGKSVRLLEGVGILGEHGGRITHSHIGKVVNVESDGNTALVDFASQGNARVSTINLEESNEQKADGASGAARARIGVLRYDRGELEKPEYLDNGWVKVDAFIGRSGFLEYRTDDGKPWIEYRPAEEAFDATTLDSFALVPLTNTHPREGLLDSENTRDYQIGTVDRPRQDGEKVRTSLLVTDSGAVKDMKRGRVELSMGYTCDVDNTPGTANGQRYDAIQRNVRGNHVALVDAGRAGSEVRARMDGFGMVQSFSDQEINLTSKIKLDGVEYEISEAGFQAVSKALKNAAASLDKMKARADGADAQIKKLEGELKLAPEKIRAEVENRAAVEADAKRILGAEAKFDGKTDIEVKRAAAEKHRGVSLDGRSDAYVEAAFDQAVEQIDGVGDAAGIMGAREKPVTAPLEAATDDGALKFLEASMSASQPQVRK